MSADTTGSGEHVSTTRVIAADVERLFEVVADPTLHHVIDGSGTVKGTSGDARKLSLGDRFTTRMHLYVPYVISNKVVEYEEGRRIAWSHIGGWRWRFEFEPITEGPEAGSTQVTETFDWSTSKAPAYIRLLKWPQRNLPGMEKTLARLDAFVRNTEATL